MDYCILLTSNLDNRYLNQERLLKSYLHNCKIPFDEIEASKPSNKELREALFQVALDNGGRAEFPALFIMRKNRFIQFVGNWDRIQNILDNDSTPEDVLQQAPDMYTFYRFFRNM